MGVRSELSAEMGRFTGGEAMADVGMWRMSLRGRICREMRRRLELSV